MARLLRLDFFSCSGFIHCFFFVVKIKTTILVDYIIPGIRLSAPQALCAVILTITHETVMIMTHTLQRKEIKLIQIQYPTTG